MSYVERAGLIIDTIEYLTIATVCPDGTPWNSPVYTVYDSDLNFYWKSWVENQHSQNVAHNGDVFLVLYDSRSPAGTGEGVYIQAKACVVEEEEERHKAHLLLKRRAGSSFSSYDTFVEANVRRVYKAVPQKIWMNDGSSKHGDYIDVRHELDIKELKNEIQQYVSE